MLTEQERQAVTQAIGEFLAVQGSARPVVAALVDDQQFALRLPDPPLPTPMQWARAIVEYCEDDAWSHVPPWLVNLLSRLPPSRPELSVVVERIKCAPPRWIGPVADNPVDVLWLTRVGMPFVDRRLLRNHLKQMTLPTPPGPGPAGQSPAVLAITGPKRSGRSYTVELLRHLVRERKAAAMVLPLAERPADADVGVVTVPSKEGASMIPEVLADRFAEVMLAPDVDPPADIATANRMNQYLSQWVVEQAVATGKEWWLVLDGLDDPDLSDETIGFVGKLAEQVAQRAAEPPVRLVLIGCPPKLVEVLPRNRLAREELGDIGEVDLEPFFEQLLIGTGSPAPPAAAVKLAVFLVLNGLPANGDRLPLLNRKLRETAGQVCHA